MKPFTSLFLALCFSTVIMAQDKKKEEITGVPLVWMSAGGYLPGADMKQSFGANAMIGVGYIQKFKNNIFLGFEFNAIFGDSIYDETKLFQPIVARKEDFLASDGSFANIRLFERGLHVDAKFGKLFPVLGPNANSGILLLGGIGYMQHKVRIEVINNNVPILDKEGKKAFDRYTNGVSLSQFIGYIHLSDNRRTNFYFGFEIIEGFTQNKRAFNHYSQGPDNTSRLDILYGFRAGWILPLYKRKTQTFYYD